jgi:hypothetical protein
MPEQHGSEFEEGKSRLDETPFPPCLADTLTGKFGEWPIVPGTTIGDDYWPSPTAFQYRLEEQECIEAGAAGRHLDVDHLEGIRVDGRPDVPLLAIDEHLRLVDRNPSPPCAVGLEQLG